MKRRNDELKAKTIEIGLRCTLTFLMIAVAGSTFWSCTGAGNDAVSPPESNTDFEGDITKFNEAYRDSIVFDSYRFTTINMMFNDGSGLHGKPNPWLWPFGVTWSPRKWKIFYIVDTASDAHGRVLFMMNADGSGTKRLTLPFENVWAAACAPDGQKIAYTVLGDTGKGKLRVAKPDGSDAHDITSFVMLNQSNKLSWSPNSRQIAFDGFLADNPHGRTWTIGVANADGSYVGPLFLSDHNSFNPDWSPDGTKVLYSSFVLVDGSEYENLFSFDIIAQKSHQITSEKGYLLDPHWSPDGTRIVLSFLRVGENQAHIYVMNADGSGMTQLTFGSYSDRRPDW